jgi:hypothetical protein
MLSAIILRQLSFHAISPAPSSTPAFDDTPMPLLFRDCRHAIFRRDAIIFNSHADYIDIIFRR